MNLNISDFFNKIQTAFEQKQAFVVYKKPNQAIVNAQFQLSNEIITNFDFNESGFVFAPFDDEKSAVFFPLTKSELFESDFLNDNDENDKTLIEKKSSDKDFHLKLVEKAIEHIRLNEFKKVVISRKEEVKLANFNLIKTYQTLLQKYPSAMVYCWFHPKIGLWMGATPELICKIKENHFSTVALAGTQLAEDNKKVVWSQKEQIEQQLVTDFIVDELKSEIQNLTISNPYSVKAGHLWHIKTDIKGEISAESSLEKIIQK
ncbi:MAG: chorismate-binding protein, partial [Flavobacteriaceae bacterium]|nr:chorismate-binding protein [Flavobacteriaceae bacterium]